MLFISVFQTWMKRIAMFVDKVDSVLNIFSAFNVMVVDVFSIQLHALTKWYCCLALDQPQYGIQRFCLGKYAPGISEVY
jgi:hypothetical protein